MSEKVCKTTGKDVQFSHGGAGKLNMYRRCDGAMLDETMVCDREEWEAAHTPEGPEDPTTGQPGTTTTDAESGDGPGDGDEDPPQPPGDSSSDSWTASTTSPDGGSDETSPPPDSLFGTSNEPSTESGELDPTGASAPSDDDTNVPRG